MSKTCTGCGETKAATEYYKDASRKDGLQSRCKSCAQAYREENKEKANVYHKAYREENRERLRAFAKAYREENRERIRDQAKAYRARRVSNSPCAIYSIFCVPEQRYYIGQTTYAHNRWRQHRNYFKSNNNPCGRDGEMQNDYNKHGPESFEYTILKELPADANEETRLEEEKNHILQFLTEGKSLYNVRNTTE